MLDARVGPRERRAFERPANRDPVPIELQRNRDGRKPERGCRDEREAPQIA